MTKFEMLDLSTRVIMVGGIGLSILSTYIFIVLASVCFNEYDLQTDSETLTLEYAVQPLGWFAFFLFFLSVVCFAAYMRLLSRKCREPKK